MADNFDPELPDNSNPTPEQPVAPQPQAAPQPPAAAPQMTPDQAHSSTVGRIFKSILGSPNISYQRDPNTGQMVQTATPQRPGQIWRSILAGALIGGAASADQVHTGSGLAAAASGFGAEQSNQERLDQQKRLQADQDFRARLQMQEEQRKQNAEYRESQRLGMEQQQLDLAKQTAESTRLLHQAETAHANAETARINVMTQGQDLENHERVSNNGKQNVQAYEEAGIQPIAAGVSEADMTKYVADHPGSGSLDWEPVETKIVLGDDGKPDYHLVYNAYDPKGTLTIPSKTLSEWEKNGVPEDIIDKLKQNPKVDAHAYVNLKHMADKAFADKYKKDLDSATLDEARAKLGLTRAQTAEAILKAQQVKDEDNQSKLYGKALDELNAEKGDFSKLSPRSKTVIAEYAGRSLPGIEKSIKDAIDDNDQPRAKELMRKYDAILGLQTDAIGLGAASSVNILDQAESRLKGKDEDTVRNSLIAASNISESDKKAIFSHLFPKSSFSKPQPVESKPIGSFEQQNGLYIK